MGSCLNNKKNPTKQKKNSVFKQTTALLKGSAEIRPDLQHSTPISMK